MAEKTILITGATNGMGKAAAIALAQQGHRIILHGRKEEAAQKIKQEIISETNNEKIHYLLADLLQLSDIHRLAEDFKEKYGVLDVLINNAGSLFGKEREETEDGIEKTVALNFIAPYLLTSLLLDNLKQSREARVVITASAGHSMMAKPDFQDIELKQGYTANRAYGNAKLYLIMMAQVFDRKLKQNRIENITINTLHPGVVLNEGMVNDVKKKGFLGKLMLPLMRLLMKTPAQGADTIVYLASSPEVKGVSGLYFSNRKPAKVNEKYITEQTRSIVWDYAAQKTGIKVFLKGE